MALGAAAALALTACSSGGGSGSSSSASFCDLAKDVETQMNAVDKVGETDGPEALKTVFVDAENALKQAAKKAPSEIKSDLNALVDGIGTFNSIGKKHDYDIMKMASDPELAKMMENDKLDTASENVQKYLETECGLTGS